MQAKPKYKRVLLKLSGEVFGENDGKGIGFENIEKIASQIIKIWKKTGIELTIVVGGGNILGDAKDPKRQTEQQQITWECWQQLLTAWHFRISLERQGAPTRMMTAFDVRSVAEPYIRRRALRHIDKGRIVIFTAGTGNPFFTTDSGAALRAVEMHCDVILKATNVDGVYSEDP